MTKEREGERRMTDDGVAAIVLCMGEVGLTAVACAIGLDSGLSRGLLFWGFVHVLLALKVALTAAEGDNGRTREPGDVRGGQR